MCTISRKDKQRISKTASSAPKDDSSNFELMEHQSRGSLLIIPNCRTGSSSPVLNLYLPDCWSGKTLEMVNWCSRCESSQLTLTLQVIQKPLESVARQIGVKDHTLSVRIDLSNHAIPPNLIRVPGIAAQMGKGNSSETENQAAANSESSQR